METHFKVTTFWVIDPMQLVLAPALCCGRTAINELVLACNRWGFDAKNTCKLQNGKRSITDDGFQDIEKDRLHAPRLPNDEHRRNYPKLLVDNLVVKSQGQ